MTICHEDCGPIVEGGPRVPHRHENEDGVCDHDPEYGCPPECPREVARYAAAQALYGHPAMGPAPACGCRLDEDSPDHGCGLEFRP